MTPKLEVTSVPSRSILHTMTGSRCLDIGSRGFRASRGLVLRWCCSVAEGLRWCCGGPVNGPSRWSGRWSGRWYGPVVRLAVRSVVRSVDQSVVWFVVWWMVQFVVRAVCGPSKHVLLHTMACQLQMLGFWSRGFCSFGTFVIPRSQDPGPRTLCPQNVVRAASWRSL